ncbi:MAG TPA: ATP-binding protein [Candidatus Binatia bacterium]|nr:ATP-binding protein [Candidatus Binatia bacterium]
MHRILLRQIERSLGTDREIPADFQKLLNLISDTYEHFDEDRDLLDRSLSLSSAEFLEKSRKLMEAKEKVEDMVRERTQELRETQARLIASIESLSLGFLILDNDGDVFHVNKMFNQILEVKYAKDIDTIDTLLKNRLGLAELFRKAQSTKQSISSKNIQYGQKAVSIFVTPITLIPTETIGAVIVIEDSTKEKQIDKAKSEFVSMASHQLRTPLTIVKWHVEALKKKILGKDFESVVKKNADHIEVGTKRMIALVQALLNASRIELGKLAIIPEKMDLGELCNTVVEELSQEIKGKDIAVALNFGKDLKMEADPNILTIILQNLLTNAIKYTQDKGRITISIDAPDQKTLDYNGASGNFLLFKITDTGYGIPKDEQPKIFTKLFRADNVKLLKLGGTGLGLYITKSIVETTGGKIWFSSPSEDSDASSQYPGATFYVLLPKKWNLRKDGSSLNTENNDLLYT